MLCNESNGKAYNVHSNARWSSCEFKPGNHKECRQDLSGTTDFLSPLGGLTIYFVDTVCLYDGHEWQSRSSLSGFSPELCLRFKQLVLDGGYTMTGAFEKFMGICVLHEALVFPEPGRVEDLEAEARIMLTWLGKRDYGDYLDVNERAL